MNFNPTNYNKNHKNEIENSIKVGCYSCITIFDSDKIDEYCENDTTAICPYCYVDAILPDTIPVPLTIDILTQLNNTWFSHANDNP